VTDTPQGETFAARLRGVVTIFLPKRLQELYKQGLLLTALALVLIVVVLPLLVAFLAAFWLSLARASNVAVIQSLRQSYVEQIRDGFGIDEQVAENSRVQNARLDYLQALDFDLGPDGSGVASPIKNVNLQVQRGQRLVLTLNEVSLNVPDDACRITESDTRGDLLDVAIGRKAFTACEETHTRVGGCVAELDAGAWKEYAGEFRGRDPDVASVLKFERSAGIRQSCGVLHVEGTIAIFKEVYASEP
jgi:hypothetical protein